MSETTNELPAQPKLFSWCTAVLCTAVLLGVLYSAEMISTGYYYAKLQKNFAGSIVGSTDLNFAVDNPEFSELFRKEQKVINDLRPIISLIDQRDGAKAALYLRRQSLPNNPLTSQLTGNIREIEALSGKNDELQNESAANDALLKSKREEYLALKADLLRFLGDQAQNQVITDKPEADVPVLTFYTAGLLAGLPALPALPDNIADFKQLGEYYTLAKSGARTPSIGEAKVGLEQLQSRGQALQSETQILTEKSFSLLGVKQANDARAEQLFLSSQATLRKLLCTLARPNVDTQTEVLYDLFQASLSKWGYQLPELWV